MIYDVWWSLTRQSYHLTSSNFLFARSKQLLSMTESVSLHLTATCLIAVGCVWKLKKRPTTPNRCWIMFDKHVWPIWKGRSPLSDINSCHIIICILVIGNVVVSIIIIVKIPWFKMFSCLSMNQPYFVLKGNSGVYIKVSYLVELVTAVITSLILFSHLW